MMMVLTSTVALWVAHHPSTWSRCFSEDIPVGSFQLGHSMSIVALEVTPDVVIHSMQFYLDYTLITEIFQYL